jgi:SAM-dependent methyltransferase
MPDSSYIFNQTEFTSERERLQRIEQVFDLASQWRLLATGLTHGWHCLEVGAGAGSITGWLAQQVGEQGKVTAIDRDIRFIAQINLPNVEIIQTDICDFFSEQPTFDLIHARCVLIHIPQIQVALTRLIDLLKPGGWLVLEEPDFLASRAVAGNHEAMQSVDRVNQAILQMFKQRGIDPAISVKLSAILQQRRLTLVTVENEAPLLPGGADLATILKQSAIHLTDNYLATGKATEKDIKAYCQFASDPQSWAIYHGMVGVIAQKII